MNEERILQTVPVTLGHIVQSENIETWVFVPVVQKPDPEYLSWRRRRWKTKKRARKALLMLDRLLDQAAKGIVDVLCVSARIAAECLYAFILVIGCVTTMAMIARMAGIF